MALRLNVPNKDYMRIDEVAHLFRRSNRTIRRWITDGDLKAHRLKSGGLLIPTTALPNVVRLSSECYDEVD